MHVCKTSGIQVLIILHRTQRSMLYNVHVVAYTPLYPCLVSGHHTITCSGLADSVLIGWSTYHADFSEFNSLFISWNQLMYTAAYLFVSYCSLVSVSSGLAQPMWMSQLGWSRSILKVLEPLTGTVHLHLLLAHHWPPCVEQWLTVYLTLYRGKLRSIPNSNELMLKTYRSKGQHESV